MPIINVSYPHWFNLVRDPDPSRLVSITLKMEFLYQVFFNSDPHRFPYSSGPSILCQCGSWRPKLMRIHSNPDQDTLHMSLLNSRCDQMLMLILKVE
jgi:hypothetical protein